MRVLIRVLDRSSQILLIAAGVAMGAMAVHIILDIGGRYFFGGPLPGTVEIVARYYMVALVFLPLPDIQREDGHFVATLFTDHLRGPVIRGIEGTTSILMAGVTALLAYASIGEALHSTVTQEQVQAVSFIIYSWPPRWLIPIGLCLMTAYALVRGIRRFLGPQPTAGH